MRVEAMKTKHWNDDPFSDFHRKQFPSIIKNLQSCVNCKGARAVGPGNLYKRKMAVIVAAKACYPVVTNAEASRFKCMFNGEPSSSGQPPRQSDPCSDEVSCETL